MHDVEGRGECFFSHGSTDSAGGRGGVLSLQKASEELERDREGERKRKRERVREDSIDRDRERERETSRVGGSFNDSFAPRSVPSDSRFCAPQSLRDGNDVEGPLASQRAARPASSQRVCRGCSRWALRIQLCSPSKGGRRPAIYLPPPSRQMQVIITQQLDPYVPSLVSARCRQHLFCPLYLRETLGGASQPAS